MKLTKRIVAAIAMLVVLSSFISVSAYNASYSVSRTVGKGVEDFERSYYFDSNKGIITAKYDTWFRNEAFIKVYHSTSVHYGRVAVDTGSARTNGETSAGKWSGWASVKVYGVSDATYIAYYYE